MGNGPGLHYTLDVAFTFNGSGNKDAEDVFSDADVAKSASMKSVSGMVLPMYGNCVFWRSKREEVIGGDTIEAELIAMSSTANGMMWAK